jgi:hypothetical protein
MSRTYKDKPWKFKNPEAADWTYGREKVEYERETTDYWTGEPRVVTSYCYREVAGTKTKKRKTTDTNWHWLQSTPSWWTRMMMNRPQRREAHLWENRAVHTDPEQLEEIDTPNVSHKPHNYYW